MYHRQTHALVSGPIAIRCAERSVGYAAERAERVPDRRWGQRRRRQNRVCQVHQPAGTSWISSKVPGEGFHLCSRPFGWAGLTTACQLPLRPLHDGPARWCTWACCTVTGCSNATVSNRVKAIRVAGDAGGVLDLYCTAQGKVLLAFADEALRDEVRRLPLRRHTDRTITSRRAGGRPGPGPPRAGTRSTTRSTGRACSAWPRRCSITRARRRFERDSAQDAHQRRRQSVSRSASAFSIRQAFAMPARHPKRRSWRAVSRPAGSLCGNASAALARA